MQVVAIAMRKILISSARFRPETSPMYPIMIPPTGLMRKAPPKTAKDSITPRSSDVELGKNTLARTSEKNPNTATRMTTTTEENIARNQGEETKTNCIA